MDTQRVRELARRLRDTQRNLETETVEVEGVSGNIRVVVFGNQSIKRIHINQDLYEASTPKELAEQLRLVINDALKKSQNLARQRLSALAGGAQQGGEEKVW